MSRKSGRPRQAVFSGCADLPDSVFDVCVLSPGSGPITIVAGRGRESGGVLEFLANALSQECDRVWIDESRLVANPAGNSERR